MTNIREEIKSIYKMISDFFAKYNGPQPPKKAERKLDDETAEQGLYLGNLDGDERTTGYLANDELGHNCPPPKEKND